MDLNPSPPPYPGPEEPYLLKGSDAMYPPPPKYSVAVLQPVPSIMQNDLTVIQQPGIQTQHSVMVINPVVVQPGLRDVSAPVKCAYCQQQIITMTQPTNGLLVWTVFGILLVCGIWPFCLIPFCVNSCKDVHHVCPKCRNVLHIYRRM